MRICDINTWYSPTGGGVRRYHDRKAAHYREDTEHEYALIVPSNREARRRVGSATFYEVPAVPLGSSGYRLIVSVGPLRRALDDFRPDVVEIGSPYLLPSLVGRALDGRPAATVGFYHADYPDAYVRPLLGRLGTAVGSWSAGLARRHVGIVYGSFTAAFGASAYSVERLRAAGVERVFRTPLGVEHRVFRRRVGGDAVRDRLRIPRDHGMLLHFARLHPEKDIDLLVDGYIEVRDPSRRSLVVVDHGVARKRVRRRLDRFPEVRFIPYLGGADEMAELISAADVVISVGRYETFSLCTLEAMACGTFVVAPSSGAAGELVRDAGSIEPFEPGNEVGMARAIEEALSRSGPEASRRLRDFVVSEFTWEAAFERIDRYYARILSGPGAGGIAGGSMAFPPLASTRRAERPHVAGRRTSR